MKRKQSFKVDSMSCNHCVANITKALNELEKVEKVKINLKKKQVDITGDVTSQEVLTCFEDAGYPAEVL